MLNAVSANWAILRRPILVAFYDTHGVCEEPSLTQLLTPDRRTDGFCPFIDLTCFSRALEHIHTTEVLSYLQGKDSDTDKAILDGNVDIVYWSAESLLAGEWRERLLEFGVSAIVIDDFHYTFKLYCDNIYA